MRHKEILWALAQGVHVFGASSIGALRAAELARFGMVGIGSIFHDLEAGRIEDDDEVAVEHGPVELGYLPLSEAMVDIRATLETAVANGVIGDRTCRLLIACGRSTFYANRHWPDLLRQGLDAGADALDMKALEDWLPDGRINSKKRDAVAMLVAIREFLAGDPPPFTPGFTFERTETWERDRTLAQALPAEGDGSLLIEDILDELRLRPHDHARVRREALARALALHEAGRRGLSPDADALEKTLRDWLREQATGLRRALDENRLDEAGLAAFLREEAQVRKVAGLSEDAVAAALLNTLRSRGWLNALAERAATKQRILTQSGRTSATSQTTEISPLELHAWFCRQLVPGRPYSISPEQLAVRLGYADVSTMSRALLREYYFRKDSARIGITPPSVSLDEREDFP
jgi:hypothetical protein